MISGIGGNPSQMMSRLFSQLDTKKQGYLEKSDLSSAFSQISGSGSNGSASVDDVFAALDGDSDGKVSFAEAQAYDQSSPSSGSGATATNGASSSSSANASDAQVMMKIMQLMHAYGGGFGQEQPPSGIASLLSASA